VLELLNQLDTQLFLWGNVSCSNVVFDWLMPFITNKKSWYPVWLLVIILLLWKGGKNGRLIILFTIPLILLSDQISAHLLKPLIGRVRPCNVLDNINILVRCSRANSMPSAHAANFFAVATYFGFYFKKYRIYFFIVATLVAYSRVYVGVHYPFDILAGALLGIVCAYVTIYLRKQFDKYLNKF